MASKSWQEILLTANNEDHVWELFHENSKLSRYDEPLSEEEVRERMQGLHESLPFQGYPIVELPSVLVSLNLPLGEAIASRASVRNMRPCSLPLKKVGTLLHYAYGVTRNNKDSTFPLPSRVVPSGGALYPLEIFFHSTHVESLQAGLYHYNPSRNHLRLLRHGDETRRLSEAIIQTNIVLGASLIVFITAFFERSIFKYADRGYRYILLEAGHVAQNIDLVSTGIGLACVNIGGFFDREIDDFLGLDGVTHSAIYMIAIGELAKDLRDTSRPV